MVGDPLGGSAFTQKPNHITAIPVVLVGGPGRTLDANRIPMVHEETAQLLAALMFPPLVVVTTSTAPQYPGAPSPLTLGPNRTRAAGIDGKGDRAATALLAR